MDDVFPFVGTWLGDHRSGVTAHTFTWSIVGDQLKGRWVIEAPDVPMVRAYPPNGRSMRIEMNIGEPWVENGALLFSTNGSPIETEFRLLGTDEAVVGASLDRVATVFSGMDLRRSLEAHRIFLVRQIAPGVQGV